MCRGTPRSARRCDSAHLHHSLYPRTHAPPAIAEPCADLDPPRNDWQTIRSLLPYLTTYKWRVAFALTCLIGAKVANLGVPIVMKRIVDSLASVQHLTALGRAHDSPGIVLIGGIGLLVVAYAVRAAFDVALHRTARDPAFRR